MHTHTHSHQQGGQLAMPSFTTVLRRIGTLWDSNREDLKAKVGAESQVERCTQRRALSAVLKGVR